MSHTHCSCKQTASEPYRLYFPLGMALGMIGVGLWPLFYAGWLSYYPMFAHTRLMIQGFAALFIFGFMLTAGPRLISSQAFKKPFVGLLLLLVLASNGLHLANQIARGDLLFTLACLCLLFAVGKAFLNRGDTPPPGFPLAALGLLCATLGSALLALCASTWPNPTAYSVGKILLFQGFTLLPILGVGPYFFPKILSSANWHDFPETLKPTLEWKRRFRASLLLAGAFLASVALEASGLLGAAYGIRLGSFALYLASQVPFAQYRKVNSPHGRQLFLALLCAALGLLGAALFPAQRVAWLHAYFVVGLTGIIFLVSVRVVFGHGNVPHLIAKAAPLFTWVTLALILAASSRIYADLHPASQRNHYLYAAAVWLACGAVWLFYVAPKTMPNRADCAPETC